MASSSSTVSDIEGRWVEISLEEEDEVGISIEGVEKEEVAIDTRWFLNMMVLLWQHGKGMYVKELEPNLFLFEFYHEVDMQKVLVGGTVGTNIDRGKEADFKGDIIGKKVTHEREKEVISDNQVG
ncbi:hypothetical protein F8388_018326 [Cannabis sativa]|uniref:DUF4283 domain-containing protein n=1 Tax=Cannabis sativa TaxID=3483 RepID=A0A7J6HFJ6_CANSA|nr:hypothetical protein F8388_018326 [Cannabis sativa]